MKKSIIYVGNLYNKREEFYFYHCFDAVKQDGIYFKFPFQ